MARTLAQSDPVLFFQTYKPPIIIDEIQKAPELFEQIKILCDESEERGLFWLTGSQQYRMMKKYPGHPGGPHRDFRTLQPVQGGSGRHGVPNKMDFSLPCLLERQKAAKKNDIVDVFGTSGGWDARRAAGGPGTAAGVFQLVYWKPT